MQRSTGKGRGLTVAVLAVVLSIAGLAAARPAAAQDCTGIAPYVFVLLDTSGSMNWAPPCSQDEIDAGFCSALCTSSDCWVPQQGDDPSSKLYQVKQALYDVLASTSGVQLGFATFNQDSLNVRAKHWIYEAAGSGINIPGWGVYPATGSREVFGYGWNCDTGTGNNEIGCYSNTPADLPDVWERTRVSRLPKLGTGFNQQVSFYVRSNNVIYRVRYTPVVGSPGSSATVTELVVRCTNTACSATTTIGQTNITFNPVSDFLSWDNGTSSLSQTNPQLSYFPQSPAADDTTGNTCTGWDPNTDSTADASSGYNLRWPTDSSDTRGLYFTIGDVIPGDWQTDHRTEVLQRLAPNVVTNPLATPDFRIASYLQNVPLGAETFLRLKTAYARPLIASGSTPLGASIHSFRQWWTGCSTGYCLGGGWNGIGQIQDPDWLCRRHALIVISDGDDTCGSNYDACTQVGDLRGYGIKTYAVGFGAPDPYANKLACMAANGGTSMAYNPHTRQDLEDALSTILTDIKAGN
jgi:hypothetical protein